MKFDLRFWVPVVLAALLSVTSCRQESGGDEAGKVPSLSGDLVKNPNTLTGNEKKIPELTFETTRHDFGKIKEGEEVSFEFRLTNTGEAPLIISEVKATCGCTTPQWPKGIIKPGESDVIKVVYDSRGRPGEFSKGVVVSANTYPNQTVLTVSGVVFKN
jgi:hypothetical protein